MRRRSVRRGCTRCPSAWSSRGAPQVQCIMNRNTLKALFVFLAVGGGAAQAALACDPSVANVCDDGNVCTDDVCDPQRGCLHASNSASCNDGNSCTTRDVCNGGVCVGGDAAAGCAPCQALATLPARGGTFIGTTSGASASTGSCGST